MGAFIQVNPRESEFRAYYAEAKDGKGPGILLCHPRWGLNSCFTDLADRLSAAGYTVLAPDLFDGRTATDSAEADALVAAFEADDGAKGIAREQAALDYLLNSPAITSPNIAAIAFSMGAAYVTWLATLRSEIAAVILFYGGSDWNKDYAENANAPVQGHWAAADPFQPAEAVYAFEAELKAAGHTPDFYTYPGTEHHFFESNRPEYDPAAAQRAWERTLAFLREHVG
jgi:carboxymethylenebutenolidase